MDKALRKKIEVVISNTYNGESEENYMCIDEIRKMRGHTFVTTTVEDEPEVWELNNRQAKVLLKLNQQLDTKALKALHKILKDYCKDNFRSEIVDAATLYFVHSGNVKELLAHLNRTFTNYRDTGSLHVVEALSEAMLHRPDLFSDKQAENINDWCQSYLNRKSKLGMDALAHPSLHSDITARIRILNSRSNEILTRNFERQVDAAFNPELNADEEKVTDAIESIGFSIDLSDSLRHIRNMVDSASTTLEYRDAMSAMRVFTEQLYGRIAQRLNPDTKVNGMKSEQVARMFREHKLISVDVSELIIAHRHFLSNDGTHRLKSRKEDARIAKNMTIELSLYLLTRLREMPD